MNTLALFLWAAQITELFFFKKYSKNVEWRDRVSRGNGTKHHFFRPKGIFSWFCLHFLVERLLNMNDTSIRRTTCALKNVITISIGVIQATNDVNFRVKLVQTSKYKMWSDIEVAL